MSRYSPATRPLVQCLRNCRADVAGGSSVLSLRPAQTTLACASLSNTITSAASLSAYTRSLSSTTRQWQDSVSKEPINQEAVEGWELDPNLTTLPWAEKELMKKGTPPIGSRRRRAAIRTTAEEGDTGSIPFELLPYQCFQEARKVLQADREKKIHQIALETAKIRKLEAVQKEGLEHTSRGGDAYLNRRLASLRKHVEELKIMADINDPVVKRRFEDGLGDMNKPIYRYLAEKRWRGRPLRLIQQRIDQFHLQPDLLSASQLVPRADVELFFRSYKVAPGAIVDSLITEVTPRLRVQVFDRGTRLVTVAIVDPDVPDFANDNFSTRCHFLAANIPLSPTDQSVPFSRLDDSQVILPWLPAFAQKGSAPQRLAVLVLEQPRHKSSDNNDVDAESLSKSLDVASLQASYEQEGKNQLFARNNFSVRSFVSSNGLNAIGCTLFRTVWDAGTELVMDRAGVPGADLELKPVKLPSLKPPRKARGWEAKRQGPKYRHLWHFTHRIATPKRKFVR